jgi:inner membrane protein
MTGPTHISFAEFLYLLLLTTAGVSLSATHAAVVALASILPDLDTGSSAAGRVLPWVAAWVERTWGHRTLTHSLLFVAGLSVLLIPLAMWDAGLYACFLTGYASHPFLDTMTVSGVRLFYPVSSVRCVFPLDVNQPFRYRARTGSRIDRMLGLVFLAGCVPTFLIAEQGYERFIRATQRNIESAVRDYNEFSPSCIVYADIAAHNLVSKERLDGRFEIVGSLNQHTLLFRGPGGALRTLGNEYQADYVAESVLCQKGEAARVVVQQVDLSAQPFSQVQEYLDPAFEHQLFGHLSSADRIALPSEGGGFSPVTGSPGSVKLSFASYEDAVRAGLEEAFIDRGVVTIRTIERGTGAGSGLRKPEKLQAAGHGPRFDRAVFQADLRDPVELLHATGDTVKLLEPLARWGQILTIQSEIDLAGARIGALREELSARLAELGVRFEKSVEEARTDSLALAAASAMSLRGFLAPGASSAAWARYRRARLEEAALGSESRAARNRCRMQVRVQESRIALLLRRREALRMHCEARSPCAGVILDITQTVREGRLHVAILIRRG